MPKRKADDERGADFALKRRKGDFDAKREVAASGGESRASIFARAASKIQAVWRGRLGRKLVQEVCIRHAWAELDLQEEKEAIDERKAASALRASFQKRVGVDAGERVAGVSAAPLDEKTRERIKYVAAAMSGASTGMGSTNVAPSALQFGAPLTLGFITAMIDQLSGVDSAPVPRETAMELARRAEAHFRSKANVVRATIPANGRLTVVGDLHGQLQDLLHIFKLNGLPYHDNAYVFNGDWVDRGRRSLAVVMIVFGFALLYPDAVHLNRGNHESTDVNSDTGYYRHCFLRECLETYDRGVYTAFSRAFAALPICALVGGRVLVVHGGLPRRTMTLDEINQIQRYHMHPPYNSIMEDLMWSDPQRRRNGHPGKGRLENQRGCGVLFGGDVLLEFLKRNGLTKMVRSHECVQEGHESLYDNRLATVFSASNYCGVNDNKGAVLIFTPDLTEVCVKYRIPPAGVGSSMADAFFLQRQKDAVLAKLVQRIARARLALIDHYRSVAAKRTGGTGSNDLTHITRIEWKDGLRSVLGFGTSFPFLQLQSALGLPRLGVDNRVGGKICYLSFLQRFEPRYPWKRPAGSEAEAAVPLSRSLAKISDILTHHHLRLASLFSFFDYGGDGEIASHEFRTGLLALADAYPDASFSAAEADALIGFFDRDGSGSIDIAEFLGGFEVSCPDLSQTIRAYRKQLHLKPPTHRFSVAIPASRSATSRAKQAGKQRRASYS